MCKGRRARFEAGPNRVGASCLYQRPRTGCHPATPFEPDRERNRDRRNCNRNETGGTKPGQTQLQLSHKPATRYLRCVVDLSGEPTREASNQSPRPEDTQTIKPQAGSVPAIHGRPQRRSCRGQTRDTLPEVLAEDRHVTLCLCGKPTARVEDRHR